MTAVNLVSDHGAVADGQWYYGAFEIATGTNTLTAPAGAPDFVVGDVGKSIMVGNAGGSGPQGGSPLITTIASYISATQVTLANNAVYPLPNADVTNAIVSWGTNNATAFDDFRTTYAGQSGIVLTIDAGTYHLASGNFDGLFYGVTELTVNATGATISGGTFQIGAGAQYGVSGHAARTQSVASGATSVILSTPSQVSRFGVGRYALMTGLSKQYGGYPANHHVFDYVLVSAIDSDSGSPTYGKITFATTALTYAYKSTWPLFDAGAFDYGGPATLYDFPAEFNHTIVINGLTVAHHAQFSVRGLSVTLNDCVFKGDFGPYSTMGQTCNLNNCTGLACTMEVDKYVKNFNMIGCHWLGVANQSTNEYQMLDSTTIDFSLAGTAKHTIIRNGCSIGASGGSLVLGAVYGNVESIVATDSEVFGLDRSGHVIAGGSNGNTDIATDFSMSDGVIFVPSSWNAGGYVEQWMLPNSEVSWYDSVNGLIGHFKILDVTQDGSGVYLHTDWSGGFPATEGLLWLRIHPAPRATFTNVTGCADVVDLSANHPAGYPINTHTKRTYTGSIVTSDNIKLEGQLQEIKIDVTTAYSGASSVVTATPGFPNQAIKISDGTLVNIEPTINLKQTGLRHWTIADGWSGAQSGDTLPTISEPIRITGSTRMTMVDISGEDEGGWPEFSHEAITNQGLRDHTFRCSFS